MEEADMKMLETVPASNQLPGRRLFRHHLFPWPDLELTLQSSTIIRILFVRACATLGRNSRSTLLLI